MSTTKLSQWRERAEILVASLSTEEKASLCSGADFWNTKGIDRVGIRPYMVSDGPHGLRKQASESDHLGLNLSVPATCFPSGAGLGATWDPDLLRQVGSALGREASAENISILLGPAINMKRHPLGGRNFEYFSEDPELAGELAAAYIEGVQQHGVGTSLKHFAANNQESNRLLVDVNVDERALREIYLRAFEIAVTKSQPWSVMSAYNKINGLYASDNRWLLTDVLRREWGHDGAVISDWGAEDDRVAGIRAGLTLEMPGNNGLGDRDIVDAVRDGALSVTDLDEEATRAVMLHLAAGATPPAPVTLDADAHHALARAAASSSAVLLKNDYRLLPLRGGAKLAILGSFADSPRYQGGGSSHINPTRLDTLLGTLEREHPNVVVDYAPGYRLGDAAPDRNLLDEARVIAKRADVVVVMVGLSDQEESEGYDRTHLRLSLAHNALVETALSVNENVVVVLSNGAPVEMPWAERASTILETYLGGQASGGALADILTGAVEPGGRLAETFPARLEDTPAFLNWPGTQERVEYRESVHVGYRYYDSVDCRPLFPFGHGLGYADVSIVDVVVDTSEFWDSDQATVTVSVTVANNSARAGSEVIQLYLHQCGAQPSRPEQELKGFQKIWVESETTQVVELTLHRRAFAHWSEQARDWVVADSEFEIRVGTSSRNIAATVTLDVHGNQYAQPDSGRNTPLGSLLEHPILGDWARRLRNAFVAQHNITDTSSAQYLMVEAFSRELPLRSLVRLAGLIDQDELDRVLTILAESANPHPRRPANCES